MNVNINLFGRKFTVGIISSFIGIVSSYFVSPLLLLNVFGLIMMLLSIMDSFMGRNPNKEQNILKKFFILLFFLIATVVKLIFF